MRRRIVDGAEMVWVAEGAFTRGSPAGSGDPDEQPQRSIMIASFWIDRTEVSTGRFRRCIEAKACAATPVEPDACSLARSGRDERPINCVRWDQASAYCRWVGARLPTEAEWEKAARGTDGRIYPWGDEAPSCSVAVWYDERLGHACGKPGPWDVGSKPKGASPWGALDMAGNVWEWVADVYDAGYYARAPATNPKGPESGSYRVLRGGGWGHDGPATLRTAERLCFAGENQTPGTGFRCAVSE